MSQESLLMPGPPIGDYTIGWICALQEEYEAACRMLDNEFAGPDTAACNDDNTYAFGSIYGHNVVIGCLAGGRYGLSSAAAVAKDMVRSFTSMRFALMVGIGGGAPTDQNDIRLGDVVVSQPSGQLGGVVQYDFVKRHKLADGKPNYERIGQLSAPPSVLLGALPEVRRLYNDPQRSDRIASHLERMKDIPEYYQRPAEDRLYLADYAHQGGPDCNDCGADGIKARPPRLTKRKVCVHYGIIGTANSLMKSVDERDQFAEDLKILCFEMEAGGLMNTFPCIVVRGICDYSDSHKNDAWHKYAALVAAAYARELLHVLKPTRVNSVPPWGDKLDKILVEIQERTTEISKKTHTIFEHTINEQQQKIMNWLTTVDHVQQHTEYIQSREQGTGQWFLNSDQYRAWLASNNRTLFCPGIPGAGKSVLTAIVVEDLTHQFHIDSNVGIAYLYCNFRRKQEHKVENLLGSLLRQLSQRQPVLLAEVQALFDKHQGKQTQPSQDEISHTLHLVIQRFSKVFVIVDALDECETSEGCRLKLLSELDGLQGLSAVHLFATSRWIPDIVEQFRAAEIFEIRADTGDVRIFLDSHVKQLPHRVHKSKEIQEEIKWGISEAVDGMFLLATMYLNLLRNKLTPNEIRRELAVFHKQPKGSGEDGKELILSNAYKKTMEAIRERGQAEEKLAKEAISWVTFAMRNLTILELQHAIGAKCAESKVDEGDLPHADDIVSVCAGLITVDQKSNIVRLAHYTTQEYFNRTQEEWFPGVHLKITKTCIGYVSSDVFANGWCDTKDDFRDRLRSYPFYSYAAGRWGQHARSISSQVQASILDLFRNDSTMAAVIQAAQFELSNNRLSFARGLRTNVTALHIVAFLGLEGIVSILLESGHNPDAKDSTGRTPLTYAAAKGHRRVVKLLLERHQLSHCKRSPRWIGNLLASSPSTAGPNSVDHRNRTPLFHASMRGHEAVVALLLAHQDNQFKHRQQKEPNALVED
ncbi:hypothetical protein FDECE_9548 [Fusarium decemcellulare]|nr:hypothetical protein FDECE_9548 [Fusarium decemcellulare]